MSKLSQELREYKIFSIGEAYELMDVAASTLDRQEAELEAYKKHMFDIYKKFVIDREAHPDIEDEVVEKLIKKKIEALLQGGDE